jgi:two-component system cell cycle sensor histidine kinase/response regulator CckA
MPPVAAPQEQGRLADHDAHIRRTVLCQSVESAPWPTLLIDSTGAIVAVSPSAQHITGVTGGAPAYSILPDSADEQTRTRFEQALEFARANHPGDPCVFRRSDHSDIEIEALPVSINGTGWLSVNLYQVSRTAVLQRLIAALRQRLHQLHGAASLHDVCTRVNTLLIPAGMGITVFEHRQPDALPVPLYATPPLDQVAFDQATLALIVQRRLPLFLSDIAPETLNDIARATGVRGHIVLLLPETGDRQHILHLWGSSVAAGEQEQLETIALHLASLLAHIIEREQSTHRRRRLDALSDAARTIVSLRSVDDVLYEICRQATMLLDAEQAGIFLPTDDPNMLVCAMTAGAAEHLKGEPIPLVGSLVGRTFREGIPLAFTNVEAEPDVYRPFWEAHRLCAALFQPLHHRGSVIGVLSVARHLPAPFNDDDRMIIHRFAELATAAVANAQLHQALAHSEQHYRLLFEQADELVLSLTPDGYILRCNRSASTILGATPGMSLFDLIDPAEQHDIQQRLNEVRLHQRSPAPWIFTARNRQGIAIVLETTAQVIRIDAHMIEIDLICRDITVRRAAEHELQRLNLELTTLLRINQKLTRLINLDDVLASSLHIITGAMRLWGSAIALYNPEGELHIRAISGASSQTAQCVDRLLVHLFPEEREVLAGSTSTLVINIAALRMQTPDMPALQRLPPEVSFLAIVPLQIEGTVIGLLELLSETKPLQAHDVQLAEAIALQLAQAIRNAQTTQEMRETSLMNARLYREAEAMRAYLDAIIQNAPDVLIVCRPDMSMQPLNQEPLTLIGYQRHELAGQPLLRIVPTDQRAKLTRAWLEVRRGESQRFEMNLLRADAGYFTALVSLDLIPDYDEVLVVIKDVTELRRLEEQVRQHEKLAALGRLVAGAAHELNNPLAVILGLSQLQMDEDIPPSIRADLEQIERAARRAAAIVHQLRAFGQPRTLELAPLNLAPVIDDTLQRLDSKIATGNVTVTVDLPPDLPNVLGELHQIEQVIFNIALNAIQALASRLPDEPRHLRFSARAEQESVVLAIEDTGPGIAPEHLSRVFEPFFTTRDVGQGMGMGLAVVYSIVQQHRGEVWVESRQGVGTTFYVRLPRADDDPATANPPTIALPRHLSILLVEDDDLVRTMAQRALERLECRVDAVSRGEEAFARALAADYDVVMTDLQMPGMDGVELYERLRALRPSLRWLILTGDTMGERSSLFLERTGLPVLHKPFTQDQLIERLAESLHHNPSSPL